MDIRLSTVEDHDCIIQLYKEVANYMNNNGIVIYNESFPGDQMIHDIINQCNYVIIKDDLIIGCYSLYKETKGALYVEWIDKNASALYLGRLVIHPNYLKQGIASFVLENIFQKLKVLGYSYLRLFVVDFNVPAIKLYDKHQFIKAKGMYIDVINESLQFNEYGYEKKISN